MLLPCNVVVRTDPAAKDMVIVDAVDPQVMAQVADEPELCAVADEAAIMLRAAIQSLS